MLHSDLLCLIRTKIVVFVLLDLKSDQCPMEWQILLARMSICQPWISSLKDSEATKMNTCSACSMGKHLHKVVAELRGISTTISRTSSCKSLIAYEFQKPQRMLFEEPILVSTRRL